MTTLLGAPREAERRAQAIDAKPRVASLPLRVSLLTGGDDPHYARGLAAALLAQGVALDFIGSDAVNASGLGDASRVRFHNLRGDQREDVRLRTKAMRLIRYYLRLVRYAAFAEPRIFHILWNNKFELVDRTLLTAYYRVLGRRVVLTAHNVNAARRDGCDSALNRLTLRCQYRLAHHVLVHTERMAEELRRDFGVPARRISVVPYGLGDPPVTDLTPDEAKAFFGLRRHHHVALFFGQIAPYKGLAYLVEALPRLIADDADFRLVIAGKVKKGHEHYFDALRPALEPFVRSGHVLMRIEHIPDDDLERYFKAADVVVMPYTEIFQSGVLFLAYSFGLPVVAADAGSLKRDIVEGRTGLVCKSRDAADLIRAIRAYFTSPLHRDLARAREDIRTFANANNSWATNAALTVEAYRRLSASG